MEWKRSAAIIHLRRQTILSGMQRKRNGLLPVEVIFMEK